MTLAETNTQLPVQIPGLLFKGKSKPVWRTDPLTDERKRYNKQ